ncbi:MAG: CoA transferase [Acidobacteria bacterium]|nr:CoA transferase [Acidobacteriota bacterium]
MFFMEALRGVRVLDLTRLLPGPMATQWLVDMGAEVIKVEEPGVGDYMRTMPPEGLFESINSGKKSVALDLKNETGLEAFLKLVDSADVLVEGFRPGVMDRLGCGWDSLHARHPRLIYAALTGYGYGNPYSQLAGHDINYLAIAGVLDQIGVKDGPPVIPAIQIADLAGGSMQCVIGILAALLERAHTGQGRFIDVSMTHGSALLLPVPLAQSPPSRRGATRLSGHYACYNVYRARDGRYLAVGALEPKFWATLCRALGCEDFIADQYAEDPRRTEIIQKVAARFATRDAEEWFAELRSIDACVTPIRTVEEAAVDLNLRKPRPGNAPALGEHNTMH